MRGHCFRREAGGAGQADKTSIATLIPGKTGLALKKDDDANQLFDRDGSHARRELRVTFA